MMSVPCGGLLRATPTRDVLCEVGRQRAAPHEPRLPPGVQRSHVLHMPGVGRVLDERSRGDAGDLLDEREQDVSIVSLNHRDAVALVADEHPVGRVSHERHVLTRNRTGEAPGHGEDHVHPEQEEDDEEGLPHSVLLLRRAFLERRLEGVSLGLTVLLVACAVPPRKLPDPTKTSEEFHVLLSSRRGKWLKSPQGVYHKYKKCQYLEK